MLDQTMPDLMLLTPALWQCATPAAGPVRCTQVAARASQETSLARLHCSIYKCTSLWRKVNAGAMHKTPRRKVSAERGGMRLASGMRTSRVRRVDPDY